MDLYRPARSKKRSDGRRRSDGASRSFRNSRERPAPVRADVRCADCSTLFEPPFVPRDGRPVYCSRCFRNHRQDDDGHSTGDRRSGRYEGGDRRSTGDRRSGRYEGGDRRSTGDRRSDGASRSFRNSRERPAPVRADVRCADCSTLFEPPFVPRDGRPVYCSRCFRNHRQDDDGHSTGDRRSGRYEDGDRRSTGDRRSGRYEGGDRRSTGDRKQERYETDDSRGSRPEQTSHTDESAGFYDLLREKLFTILGGRVCSGCGYRDERALGFSHVHGEISFDKIRRGGAVSSWEKYVMDPDAAQKELKVLCLNCNEIRQPITRSKNDRSNTGQKIKRFPR